jgi:intraflagellar transport protein 172
VATCFLSELEIRAIYLQQAKDLDTHGHYKDAEKLYIKAQEHDLAINMYRKAHLFNHMIRLIANHRQVLIFLFGWFHLIIGLCVHLNIRGLDENKM